MQGLSLAIFLSISCALCILTLNHVEAGNHETFQVSPKMDISELEPGSPPSDLGAVSGARPCGGSGKVVEWRYESCTDDDHPCKIPGDGQKRQSELEFIPSKDIFMLGIRYNVVKHDGSAPQTVYDRPMPNSGVQSGKTYVHRSRGGPPKEMAGRNFTFQYILYRVDDTQVETCSEADFQVTEPSK